MNHINLNNLKSPSKGILDVEDQRKLEALLRETTIENWREAMNIVLDGYNGSLWKWALFIMFDHVENYETMYNLCPDNDDIFSAIMLAQVSVKRGYSITGRKIRPMG